MCKRAFHALAFVPSKSLKSPSLIHLCLFQRTSNLECTLGELESKSLGSSAAAVDGFRGQLARGNHVVSGKHPLMIDNLAIFISC